MMRRCALRLSAGASAEAWTRIKSLQPPLERSFEEKKRALEEEEMRKMAGKSFRPVTNAAADHHDATIALENAQMGKAASQFDGKFTTSQDDLRKWMNAKHAAQILQIPEKKLYGLQETEVREAWQREYTHAKNHRQREEVDAAAQVLLEYATSDVGRERTLDHFAEHLVKTKGEIQQELDKNKQGTRNRLYEVLGIGHLMITGFFTLSIVLMYRYIEKHDAELAIMKAKRHFKNSVHAPQNDEPAPDYQTRYRDTPTELDEHMAQPNPEITEPQHRRLLQQQDADMRREEQLLAAITDDVATQADRNKRESERQRLEDLKHQYKNLSSLQIIDGVMNTVPPPAIGHLRREEARDAQAASQQRPPASSPSA